MPPSCTGARSDGGRTRWPRTTATSEWATGGRPYTPGRLPSCEQGGEPSRCVWRRYAFSGSWLTVRMPVRTTRR
jgi:hypothetical protein